KPVTRITFTGTSRRAQEGLGRLHQGLRQRRMSMDRRREILGGQRRLDREGAFGDQLTRPWADDPDAEHAASVGVGHELRVAIAEARLDLRPVLGERRHRRVEPDLHEELLAPAGERLDEVTVDTGQETIGHLDERHLAAERGVDLAELETDVPPTDDEEAL